MTALYIHWPFCRKKCPYCDFNSHVRETVEHERWLAALQADMRHQWQRYGGSRLSSIFFGGGTPSLMPPALVEALLNQASTLWGVEPESEITLEANPTSSEASHFAAYRRAGVNRLSLGVQSLDDEALRFLGREHGAAEALEVLAYVREQFPRYSFDLIYGRPEQTLSQWEQELDAALSYAGDHLSLYQLTIEPDTAFARVYAKGGFRLPDPNQAAALYELTEAHCSAARLPAYEVSNYAKPGQESRHNLAYWRGQSYIGVGPGAHGRVTQDGSWLATSGEKSPERWLALAEANGHGLSEVTALTDTQRAEEILLSGLRLREGVGVAAVAPVLDREKHRLLTEMGLLEPFEDRLQVSRQGHLLIERIALELLAIPDE